MTESVEELIKLLKVGFYNTITQNYLKELGSLKTVELLTGVLKDANRDARKVAATALGELCDNRAVEPLIKSLRDEDTEVRTWAAWSLGKIHDTRAVEPLIQLLNGEQADVCCEAAWALGELDDPSAIEPIINLLKSETSKIRLSAINSLCTLIILAEIKGHRRLEYLSTDLKERMVNNLLIAISDDDKDICIRAIGLLEKVGDTRAIKLLVTKLLDKYQDVRSTAAWSLHKFGWKPSQDEQGAAFWVGIGEFQECTKIGPPAVEPLITALDLPNLKLSTGVDVRELEDYMARKVRIIDTLGTINDIRAIEVLRKASKFSDIVVGSGWDSTGDNWHGEDRNNLGEPIQKAAKKALKKPKTFQRKN